MKNVVIVGATGAVGVEMIRCLSELKFPVGRLRLVASERSVGREVETPFGRVVLEGLSEEVFEASDFALFSAGSEISKEWRERVVKAGGHGRWRQAGGVKDAGSGVVEGTGAGKDEGSRVADGTGADEGRAGCLMIDNSSAFRYEDDVPLVVPGVNSAAAFSHKGVISNPNCTTAIAAMALWPLHQAFGLRRVIVSTYQATSGAGAKGMQELIDQTGEVLEKCAGNFEKFGECQVKSAAFLHQIAFNLIPQIDKFQENGYTKEEMKVALETRKIFGISEEAELPISCTAVRIPTLRAHSESIVLECERPVDVEEARRVLGAAPGVEVVDEPEAGRYPMPINASGKFAVEVGRIRQNLVFGDHGLEFFVCGDQLLRGAALNAVEIAGLFV